MSVLADFYVSSPDQAASYDKEQKADQNLVASYKNITPLEITTLWAIVENREWDVALLDRFTNIPLVDSGERLIHELPNELFETLFTIPPDEMDDIANRYCRGEDVKPIITDLVLLARIAQTQNKKIYLWNCV
jgi:hypothetical protein